MSARIATNAAIGLAACLCGSVLAAADPSVELRFSDGRVWITTANAPIPYILREWSRISGATIVNGDGVQGPPVTVHLEGVPEGEALETILRDAAGYVAVLRSDDARGPLRPKHIVIVPRTSPAETQAVAANPARDNASPSDEKLSPLADLIRKIGGTASPASAPPAPGPGR